MCSPEDRTAGRIGLGDALELAQWRAGAGIILGIDDGFGSSPIAALDPDGAAQAVEGGPDPSAARGRGLSGRTVRVTIAGLGAIN